MITFTYVADSKKPYIEVEGVKDHAQTMIKLEDTSNEGIMKVCQEWLDAFGIVNIEYRVLIQLH